jgi:hypothetical protein
LVGPNVNEIALTGSLSRTSEKDLDRLLETARRESTIVSMKIWRLDGTIIYSSFKEMIGKKFPISDSLGSAMKGKMSTDFEGEAEDEESSELKSGKPLLAIYNPVYFDQSQMGANSPEIIAVAEFYLKMQDIRTGSL